MIIDHLGWFPSLFEIFTGRGQLLISAAEGFVLVSGVLVGRLRGEAWKRGEASTATAWLLRRALKLALWSIGLTLLFTAWARGGAVHADLSGGVSTAAPLATVLRAITLRYTFGLHDILPLYALFLAAAPLFLWLAARGFGFAALTASFALWAAALVAPSDWRLTGSYFSEAAWQFLFFLGVFCGLYFRQLEALGARAWRTRVARALFSLGLLALLGSWLAAWVRVLAPPDAVAALPELTRWSELVFSKIRLGPGRVLLALTWFGALYVVLRLRAPAGRIARFLGGIGQQSLYVYVLQSIVLFFPAAYPTQDLLLASTAGALALGLVGALVRVRHRLWFIPS